MMIEKIARAMAEGTNFGNWDDPKFYAEDHKKLWRQRAEIALRSLREPTDGMKNASDEIHWDYSCYTCGGLADGWHGMIDAALKRNA